jgi:hypothetical protein
MHSLTANIGQFGSIVTALFIYFFEGRIFSRWIVTNITSARGTLDCRKTRIPCGDQPLFCGLYCSLHISFIPHSTVLLISEHGWKDTTPQSCVT